MCKSDLKGKEKERLRDYSMFFERSYFALFSGIPGEKKSCSDQACRSVFQTEGALSCLGSAGGAP